MHQRESYWPTSTGRLIERVVEGARCHLFHPDLPLRAEEVIDPQKPLWILHPLGEPMPVDAPPSLQLLLLDGNWREATRMVHAVRSWGRPVNLPMRGPSRYWLRGQQAEGTYSTVEALLFVLQALGLEEAQRVLRRQFELHVYAGLLARGDKAGAQEYLDHSPIAEAFPELLAALAVRRPNPASGGKTSTLPDAP